MASLRTWRTAAKFLEVQGARPTIVPKGPLLGLVRRRRAAAAPALHRPWQPTVVFEVGLTSDWYELQNQLAGFTRVCSYDRPGGPRSRSDPAPSSGPPQSLPASRRCGATSGSTA